MERSGSRHEGLTPRATIVVPVLNEGDRITGYLDELAALVHTPYEVLVVFDTPTDTTVPHLEAYAQSDARAKPVLNTLGRGPARAIKSGIASARAPVIVISMADGSDELAKIDAMVDLVEKGAVVVSASRYVRGGRQLGGPIAKRLLSRLAGSILWTFGHIGTHDPTNAFKAYSAEFVRSVGIESEHGFEMGLELCAKARRVGAPVREVPAVWRDRTAGSSGFKLVRWLPAYLRWFAYAFGRPMTMAEMSARRG